MADNGSLYKGFDGNFVEKMKFDRLGVFEFSKEKGSEAYSMKHQILSKTKKLIIFLKFTVSDILLDKSVIVISFRFLYNTFYETKLFKKIYFR